MGPGRWREVIPIPLQAVVRKKDFFGEVHGNLVRLRLPSDLRTGYWNRPELSARITSRDGGALIEAEYSNPGSAFYKLWFAFVGLFILLGIALLVAKATGHEIHDDQGQVVPWWLGVLPLAMAAFGYVIFRAQGVGVPRQRERLLGALLTTLDAEPFRT
jgi:hypothetical protein